MRGEEVRRDRTATPPMIETASQMQARAIMLDAVVFWGYKGRAID